MQQEIPFTQKIYDLYKDIYQVIEKMPKKDKYSIGLKIDKGTLDLLELIITAGSIKGSDEKINMLTIASSKLDLLKLLVRPYSSWQKGGVENANKMIRRYIPKGSDIAKYSDKYVRMVVERINNKPRKSLSYKTAKEVMIQNNLLKINKNAPNILGQKVALRG